MRKKLFDNLSPKFNFSHIPPGTQINQELLEEALEQSPDDYTLEGKTGDNYGKAVVIRPDASNAYLKYISNDLMGKFMYDVDSLGRIDWWVTGTGEKGQVAFSEQGIPFKHDILLVKLADNTIKNAVKDGKFNSYEEAPKYALSMGVRGISRYSEHIMLLASGERKAKAISKSLVGEITENVPISFMQDFIDKRGAVYVIDEAVAQYLLQAEAKQKLRDKHVKFLDMRKS